MTTQEEGAPSDASAKAGPFVLARDGLHDLIQALKSQGYTPVGPVVQDGAIVLDEIDSADDLPWGWTDDQEAGRYRLAHEHHPSAFHFTQGPQSFKKYLYPPEVRLWRASKNGNGFTVEEDRPPAPRYAFLGVRACDLAAIDVLDRVFDRSDHPDPTYQARRHDALFVAVNCATAGGTCFCVSMDTGPKAKSGFDLALTEVVDEPRHDFVIEVGSERGRDVLAGLAVTPADEHDVSAAARVSERTMGMMGRSLDTDGLAERLSQNIDHPHWNKVAERCLTCANCTMVCPTCFCSTVDDRLDLDGAHAERWRHWDSCFTLDFTFTAGGAIRQGGASRYRQWLTHKLSTWVDQFDTFGCVGCGRCISWCPVGIDITDEAAAIVRPQSGQGD